MNRPSGYKPISDYAAIGNLRTVALVCRDGSIDWCCFPHHDHGSVFAAILDHRRGGRFRVSAVGTGMGDQQYIEDTNVVTTTFRSSNSSLSVTDMMPLSGKIDGRSRSNGPDEIHRILKCRGGAIDVELEWSPRFDFARSSMDIWEIEGGFLATDGEIFMTLSGAYGGAVTGGEFGPVLRTRFSMRDGEQRLIVTRWNSKDTTNNLDESTKMLERTVESWRNWAHGSEPTHSHEWAGQYLPLLIRSELVIKMLAHTDTGAIAAAPTTSLPEVIGGARNWDYRYAWIRDASLCAQALISLGHEAEAIEFLEWMERVSEEHFEAGVGPQIMYSIHGESDLEEVELPHLEGYRGSRPVLIGNGAVEQLQLEVYGELLMTGYEFLRRGIELDGHIMDFLRDVADHACSVWENPDQGIWEFRTDPRHFVYSKVLIWVALDRAIHLAEDYGLSGDVTTWKETRDLIHQRVLDDGYDPEVGAFVQAFGSKDLDAANLRIPLLEFLPCDDPRVQGTIDRTIESLTKNGLVYRYHSDDGLPGKEGAFVLCTCWLVDALALSGRTDEAREILENVISHVNHAGLLSEQLDPGTGAFLGNFPQAFSHIGLINSVLYLAYAEGREIPEHAPIGTPEHRRKIGREHALYHDRKKDASPPRH